MRRITLLPLLLTIPLAACDQAPSGIGGGSQEAGGASIPCALAGATEFKSECTVERSAMADGIVLTLHHPDGGFRRLQVANDGRGVITADGADAASVKVVGADAIEVSIGEDRYRLPATVKGQAAPAR
ncbi:hypothetical protein HZF05_19890 [Sphingomonas sp. CGMCC 1.13654]|uniref:Lipoprotein n=1 Tax=Sphingomonas chungangi TaxID=2683589 RepID=A0A838LCI3_9SPHN|nr:hypothetical protein [Sphingomonas chungangi]MBA2936349.1 hypothetical protein [Sphingomonas chungangi]MVW55734.1 hypothetical protein [Sphingomonas chungangi]